MANHKSTLKRIKQTKVRTERNRYYKSRIKHMIRAVKDAVKANNLEEAQKAFRIANRNIHKYVSKGVLKKNTASRKVSRLNALVKKIAS